jgi:hypothetical protein
LRISITSAFAFGVRLSMPQSVFSSVQVTSLHHERRSLSEQPSPAVVAVWLGRRPSHAGIVGELDQPRFDHAGGPVREILLDVRDGSHRNILRSVMVTA